MSDMQVVVFSLNNELCGADTSQIQEIVKYQEPAKLPRMPKFLDGVINLRGVVVPIVNLNRRFELGDTEVNKKTKIIITKIEGNFVGFVVNDVSEILKLSDDDIEVTPEIIQKAGNGYLRGVGKKGEKLISILDLSGILDSSEVKKIDNKKLETKKQGS